MLCRGRQVLRASFLIDTVDTGCGAGRAGSGEKKMEEATCGG